MLRTSARRAAITSGGEGVALTAAEALAAATALVDDYCADPPADVRTAAIARLSNWIQRAPSDGIASVTHSDQTAAWKSDMSASGMMLSGAAGMVASWRRPRGRVIA